MTSDLKSACLANCRARGGKNILMVAISKAVFSSSCSLSIEFCLGEPRKKPSSVISLVSPHRVKMFAYSYALALSSSQSVDSKLLMMT